MFCFGLAWFSFRFHFSKFCFTFVYFLRLFSLNLDNVHLCYLFHLFISAFTAILSIFPHASLAIASNIIFCQHFIHLFTYLSSYLFVYSPFSFNFYLYIYHTRGAQSTYPHFIPKLGVIILILICLTHWLYYIIIYWLYKLFRHYNKRGYKYETNLSTKKKTTQQGTRI